MSLFDIFSSRNKNVHPVVLVMYDGWGLAPPSKGNAISTANTPNMDMFYRLYPSGELIASGESVGLPAGEVGNSEVGHLTAGVGKAIYQSLKRINLSIEKGDFFENRAIMQAVEHAVKFNSNIHIMGLASSGNVHSSLDHLFAILQLIKKHEFQRVYLHLFTDGRDAPPNDGVHVIRKIEEQLAFMKQGAIATVSGRYYAMDRDGRWERVQKVYEAMTMGIGKKMQTAEDAVNASYNSGQTDEFVEPSVITRSAAPPVSDNDSCIFFNFRVDRARELAMAFTIKDFEHIKPQDYGFKLSEQNNDSDNYRPFTRSKICNNLFFVTMTEYQKNIPVSAIVFPPESDFPDSLPEVLSKNNLKQFHLAESEKERMVTYYFRGMSNYQLPGEDIKIVPSPKVPTYDKVPEMSLPEIVKEFKSALSKDKYHFFVMNFANPDMVAHSGNMEATIKAIEAVDGAVGEVVGKTLEAGGTVIISADHGNAEELLTFPDTSFYYTTEEGELSTDHSSNPVPVLIISNYLRGKAQFKLKGTLADIAPTICAIMKLPVPQAMQGRNLLVQNGQANMNLPQSNAAPEANQFANLALNI